MQTPRLLGVSTKDGNSAFDVICLVFWRGAAILQTYDG